MPEETLAKHLYANYCVAVGGHAFNGDLLPTWDEFSKDTTKQKQVTAWRIVAKVAITSLKHNHMPKKIQRVMFNDSSQKPVDVSIETSYDTLSLSNEQGILVWKKDRTIIPHSSVLAIVEMELTDEPAKQE